MALEVPALAAPPANDSITAATPLGAPPGRFVVDTRQATASPTDGRCVHGRSVWFRTRPDVTRTVRLSTIGSDYDTVMAVFRGPRTNRTLIACVDDVAESVSASRQVRFVEGNTYWVAVSACCGGNSPGGRLVLNTFRPAAAGVTATIESVETGAVSGRLLVHGTARCNTPSELRLELSASQRVAAGANVARGHRFSSRTCGTQVRAWTAVVDSQTGWAFQPGPVSVTFRGSAFDGFESVQFGPRTSNFVATDNATARAAR
jgi:hypothetical protein